MFTLYYLYSTIKRHVLFVEEKFFVIIDEIELEQEGTVQWLLHGLNEFRIN